MQQSDCAALTPLTCIVRAAAVILATKTLDIYCLTPHRSESKRDKADSCAQMPRHAYTASAHPQAIMNQHFLTCFTAPHFLPVVSQPHPPHAQIQHSTLKLPESALFCFLSTFPRWRISATLSATLSYSSISPAASSNPTKTHLNNSRTSLQR